VFYIKEGKAYYADGRQMELGRAFVCQYCQQSPPFCAEREIDFAKHIIDKHPEHAKPEPQDRRPKTEDQAPIVKKKKKKKKKG